MKYYKLRMDTDRKYDIICHFEDDYGMELNKFQTGKKCDNWDKRFEFYYLKEEGYIWSDYLANDKGWFLVSNKLKLLLESMNTQIEFFPVNVKEMNNRGRSKEYYVANIVKVVEALCLDESDYSQVEIDGIGIVYIVSLYGIYAEKTDDADVFKLGNRQEIPIFVSERFKKRIEEEKISGIALNEINVIRPEIM